MPSFIPTFIPAQVRPPTFKASICRYRYIPEAVPPTHDGLLEGLKRLSKEIILKIADKIFKDPFYEVDYIQDFGIIYCRWDAYVTICRPAILLLLRTGAISWFILHVCHVNEKWPHCGATEFWPRRLPALEEIHQTIQALNKPFNTDFSVDCGEKLYQYNSSALPPPPGCGLNRDVNVGGLMVSLYKHNAICYCCLGGCHENMIRSLVKCTAIVNPETNIVTFYWFLNWTPMGFLVL